MANLIWRSAFLLSLAVSTAYAQDADIKCGPGNLCPEDKPCCSRMHYSCYHTLFGH